jgi:hypothetical protein
MTDPMTWQTCSLCGQTYYDFTASLVDCYGRAVSLCHAHRTISAAPTPFPPRRGRPVRDAARPNPYAEYLD